VHGPRGSIFGRAFAPPVLSMERRTVGATEALVPRLTIRRKFRDMSLRALPSPFLLCWDLQGRKGVSFLTRFVARSDCTASHSLNSAALLLGCRKCTALLLIVGKVASFLSAFLDLVKMRVGATTLHPPSCYVGICLRNGARPNRGSRFGLYGLGPSALRTAARDKGV
jgi:hypothetical protein